MAMVLTSCADNSDKQTAALPDPHKVYPLSALTKQPEFPGGINILHKKIDLHFIMPDIESMIESDGDARITAKYRMSFIIEKNGQ